MTETQGSASGYVFLRDEPAPADSFGAHKQVADAIAVTMACNPAIRTIGIVGPWGSGKSTVVRLLGKALLERPEGKPPFFTFDAWLHHGEPVRRAFLEAFFNFCTDHNTADKTKLKEGVDQVTGRSTTTETIDVPHISWSGLIVLAAIALGAYGLAKGHDLRRIPWVTVVLSWFPTWFPVLLPALVPLWVILNVALWRWAIARRLDITLAWVAGLAGVAVVGVGAAVHFGWHPVATGFAAPVVWLAAAGFGFWRQIRKTKPQHAAECEKDARKPNTPKDETRNEESILGLLLSRQHQSKRTRVSGAQSPTAIEFSDAFQATLGTTFPKGSTVVIVVDNLDRLPDTEAKEAWAMLRTFFRAPEGLGPERDAAPLVIVPVAEEAITAMYDSRTTAGGQSFMDKTFDVVFHLPRPVLTGWQSYLEQRMRELFKGELRPEWITQTTQLADARFIADKTIVTPRGINALVNRLGAYWMQYRNADIPFASVVWYCLNKTGIDDNILEAVEKPNAAVDVFDATWRQSMAALHYGVPLTDALQVLLKSPLERAIVHRTDEEFRSALAVPGAATILRRLLSGYREPKPLAKDTLFNAIHLVADAEEQGLHTGPEVWLMLADALPASTPWREFTERDAGDCIVLIDRLPDSVQGTVARLDGCLRSFATPETATPESQAALWRHVANRHPDALDAIPHISVVGSGETVTRVARALDDVPLALHMLTCTDPSLVLKVLVGDLNINGVETVELERRLLAVKQTAIRIHWRSHLQESLARIQAVPNNNQVNPAALSALSAAFLSVAIHGNLDGEAKQEVRTVLGSRMFQILNACLKNQLWAVAGFGMGLVVLNDLPLANVAARPLPDEAWPVLASGFVRALRHGGTDVDKDGLPAVLLTANHRLQGGFDYGRLLTEANALLATEKRARQLDGRWCQTFAPASFGGE